MLNLDTEAGIESAQDSSSEAGIMTNSDEKRNVYNGLHGAFNPNKRVKIGDSQNVANRWFDKTIQIHTSRDGSFGLNFEHSPMDGPAIIALVNSVLESTSSDHDHNIRMTDDNKVPSNCMIPLKFTTPQHLQQELEKTFDMTNNLIGSMQGTYGKFVPFGKQEIKSLGVSPDAFIQVGMQLAYNRLHPDLMPPPTYESGSLRRFMNGRTECIRSCSPQSVEFTQIMRHSSDHLAQKGALIEACAAHSKYTKLAMSAKAFDRHFLGLKAIAIESGLVKEELVKNFLLNPHFARLSDFRISSSQISSKWDISVLFGPTSPDGYGFCYNIQDKQIVICSSSFRKSADTRAPVNFLQAFGSSLKDMRRLFE
ncbi:hypothetical protein Ciccas_003031 [Cichlidogyrus casuarinus]|uniref:Choline/carnitine acyltransferase domain-containing protein n=1 Tax=Cichlidogyrus casuarinus TaxID=1844966 RepID=A0ABD2QFM1_9PLAT